MLDVELPARECFRSWALNQLVSGPMRNRHEQYQPHICDCGFSVHKRLQRKRKNDCRPPANTIPIDPRSPGENRQCNERRRDCRWKTRGEIVLAEDCKTGDLRPIGEGWFVQAKLVIEMRDDVIASLNHFARSFGEARLIAVDQRQAPSAGEMKKSTA